LYFEWYRPTGFLLLALVMLGFVAGAVGQTNPNHLAREQSQYLSRAMNQPVDWYPWGADPFKRAKELQRPILLDVGAVWCPWCALMDRDTYTNVDTANYINQHFVAVRVDFDTSPKLVALAAERPSRAKSSCRATSHIIHHARRQALLWSRVPPC
jgi:thioredoxin-related protein